MATTDKPTDTEYGKEVPPPQQPPTSGGRALLQWRPAVLDLSNIDVVLRSLLFAASVVAIVVIVTSNQTELVPNPFTRRLEYRKAEFNHSPAFIYFVVAFSVAGLYSIITTLASISVILKPNYRLKFTLHFLFWDALILGVVASATGAAGAVAYVGLKGNNHVGWVKVCNRYDKYCRHLAGSLAVALFASIVVVLLIWLSSINLHRRIPK
ncbi:CASP-like protein [Quillaja saponaria]|uniref:CASP-like protein n=1 Tax=Quillaja saponaria TaxID=32244 RepID=A0AAD7PGT6_QUISA|nr:CASP-like protein [Quillaja saponaria]